MNIETWLWKIGIIIISISFVSAAFVLVYFLKKRKSIKNRAITTNIQEDKKSNYALKRWRFFAIFWPLTCFVFAGIIVSQSSRGAEEHITDTIFSIIPLVFFTIGMTIRHRLLKERRYATILTTATVISDGIRSYSGKNTPFPEFEFQVNGTTYKVKSLRRYRFRFVQERKKVALYYAPENPRIFYVPIMQKHDNRCSILFCGIGVIFPLIGLFAPQIRTLFSFLP